MAIDFEISLSESILWVGAWSWTLGLIFNPRWFFWERPKTWRESLWFGPFIYIRRGLSNA